MEFENLKGRGEYLLIVEDDPVMQALLEAIFDHYDYIVYTAVNGEEALERWKSTDIALVLTDIHMSKVNGIELAKKLRAESPDLPIIGLSGISTRSTLKDKHGKLFADFIQKPFKVDRLLQAVRTLLDKAGD